MKQPTDDAADLLIRLHATYRAVMQEAQYLVSLHSRIHVLSCAAHLGTEKLLKAIEDARKLEQETCRPTE